MELTETENVAEVVFTASATLACNEIFGGIDWKKNGLCMFRHLNITQLCGVYFYTRRGMVLITELALDEKEWNWIRRKSDFSS